MATPNLKQVEARIEALKRRLAKTAPMRPGALTVQYRDPAARRNPFHQLSYTHRGRSRSEYVRPENLAAVRREVAAYKAFRKTFEDLVDLSIEASKLRMAASRAADGTTTPARRCN